MRLSAPSNPRWLSVSLGLSSVHSILWGLFIIVMPLTASRVYGFDTPPRDTFLWQGVGLVIILFGIGYAIAALDPFRHWAVVLIGLLAKVIGPMGMIIAVARDEVSSGVLRLLPVNDVMWWIPFAVIVAEGIRRDRRCGDPQPMLADPQERS